MLGDGGNGGGSNSLALFSSTEHEGLVNSVKTDSSLEMLVKLRSRKELTVEVAEFQLQLAEASWRAGSGSFRGT